MLLLEVLFLSYIFVSQIWNIFCPKGFYLKEEEVLCLNIEEYLASQNMTLKVQVSKGKQSSPGPGQFAFFLYFKYFKE